MFRRQLSAAALLAFAATSSVSAEGLGTAPSRSSNVHSVSVSMTLLSKGLPATLVLGCAAPTLTLLEIRARLGTPCSPALCLAEPAPAGIGRAAQCTPADGTN